GRGRRIVRTVRAPRRRSPRSAPARRRTAGAATTAPAPSPRTARTTRTPARPALSTTTRAAPASVPRSTARTTARSAAPRRAGLHQLLLLVGRQDLLDLLAGLLLQFGDLLLLVRGQV